MRPPILYLTIAFGIGLFAALNAYAASSAPYAGLLVLVGAVVLARRAPLGAACGLMLIAGIWWGNAATREQAASCAGRWNAAATNAAVVRLNDPAPAAGGVVEAVAQPGRCGGSLLIRWPDGHAAHGGTLTG